MKKNDFLKFLPLLLMVVFFSCKEENSVKLESTIVLDKTDVVLNPGGSVKLNAYLNQAVDDVRVATGDDVSLTWRSMNDSIATVSGGTVTAVTGGEVYIVVKSVALETVDSVMCKVVVRDVYVCGEYGTKDVHNVCVWKNGKLFQTLVTGENVSAKAMAVTDAKEVYVTGFVEGVGKVWKDGVELYSGVGSSPIAVDGNDVYFVRYDDATNAKIWKNGVAMDFSINGNINAICVEAGKVYAAGTKGSDAMVWINGVETKLAENTECTDIFVENGVVYATGIDQTTTSQGIAWKNGTPLPLDSMVMNTVATCITVKDGDVFVGGGVKSGNSWIPAHWMNGVKGLLGSFVIGKDDEGKDQWWSDLGVTSTYTIQVSDVCTSLGDVYYAGYYDGDNQNATYWKNGQAQKLEKDDISQKIPTSNRARAVGIVVK